jgi:hypothetical protein
MRRSNVMSHNVMISKRHGKNGIRHVMSERDAIILRLKPPSISVWRSGLSPARSPHITIAASCSPSFSPRPLSCPATSPPLQLHCSELESSPRCRGGSSIRPESVMRTKSPAAAFFTELYNSLGLATEVGAYRCVCDPSAQTHGNIPPFHNPPSILTLRILTGPSKPESGSAASAL